MAINKGKALKIVLESSLRFKKNLENKNLMFIFSSNSKFEKIEVAFTKDSFLHLTGLVIDKDRLSAKNFYKKSTKKRLSTREFEFKEDGTTDLKLSVLKKMMNIHKDARYIGNYNNSRPFLVTDTLAGDKFSVIGFQEYDTGVKPNTLLKEDISELSNNVKSIVIILRKNIKDNNYSEISYCKTGLDSSNLLQKLNINYIKEVDEVLEEVAATKIKKVKQTRT
ncbi:MAG: PBECR4 domain-containing protein [Clostridium chrysemydis]|uniref:PBECR4 domain-containing protein n=1 Tax=Clostridium chrysemydis TaxID=2665504 RepID=UPI003F3382AB